jgi:hypothetical protein
MKPPNSFEELAILGIAQIATEEMLAAQLKLRTVEQIHENLRKSAYWYTFCLAAEAGKVPENLLPGALGRVVLGWAKGDLEEAKNSLPEGL